ALNGYAGVEDLELHEPEASVGPHGAALRVELEIGLRHSEERGVRVDEAAEQPLDDGKGHALPGRDTDVRRFQAIAAAGHEGNATPLDQIRPVPPLIPRGFPAALILTEKR